MSEPTRYTLEMVSSEGGEVHWMHDNGQGLNAPLGEYVLYSDYDRLKAEVEAYRSASDEVAAAFLALPSPHNQVARLYEGIESLKAEVEEQAKRWAESEDLISHYKQQRDEAYNDCKCLGLKAELENANRINRELLVLCNQQANKIRKLTEAGDEMAFHIGNDIESQLKCSDQWRATKES